MKNNQKNTTNIPLQGQGGWWWKILAVLLLSYTIYFGLMGTVPRRAILNESIRNVYFHVPMWFAMSAMLITSVYNAVRYLRSNDLQYDTKSVEFTNVAILLGILGCATGSIWANFTWGDPWPERPQTQWCGYRYAHVFCLFDFTWVV